MARVSVSGLDQDEIATSAHVVSHVSFLAMTGWWALALWLERALWAQMKNEEEF